MSTLFVTIIILVIIIVIIIIIIVINVIIIVTIIYDNEHTRCQTFFVTSATTIITAWDMSSIIIINFPLLLPSYIRLTEFRLSKYHENFAFTGMTQKKKS